MTIVVDLLFWIHLISLGLGGVAVFGMPIVGARVASATPEMRPVLFGIADRFSMIGRGALGTLIVTGILMFWLAWNFTAPSMTWFGLKMLFVVILLGIVIYGGITAKRAQSGDMAAARRMPMLSMAGIVTFVLIILSAVFTFEAA